MIVRGSSILHILDIGPYFQADMTLPTVFRAIHLVAGQIAERLRIWAQFQGKTAETVLLNDAEIRELIDEARQYMNDIPMMKNPDINREIRHTVEPMLTALEEQLPSYALQDKDGAPTHERVGQ